MLSSLVSWSFSLIFSALLAREVAHRVRGADYRAIGAAAYLGVGSVWALGLSSSAALIMAAPASLPTSIMRISGVIPLSQTLGLWQSLRWPACSIVVSMAICYYSAPAEGRCARHGGHGRRRIEPATHAVGKRDDAGRVARVQPAAHDRSSCALGFGYLVARDRDEGPVRSSSISITTSFCS